MAGSCVPGDNDDVKARSRAVFTSLVVDVYRTDGRIYRHVDVATQTQQV